MKPDKNTTVNVQIRAPLVFDLSWDDRFDLR